MGPSKKSLSLLYKAFLWPLLTYISLGWFPFLSYTNITKLECLHQAADRTITGCLSSSPIPLLLSEASLSPLRVTLPHFTLSSYERALRLPIFFPISCLLRVEVKPRLFESFWRDCASTHPLMLPSTCSREALLACPPSLPWNLSSFSVEPMLFSPCSRSDLPLSLSRQAATLAHLDSLPLTIWYSGQTALFLFLLARWFCVLASFSLCGTDTTLSFLACPVCSSFSAKTCAILYALCWSRQHQKVCRFSSLFYLSDSRSILKTLSSPLFFVLL